MIAGSSLRLFFFLGDIPCIDSSDLRSGTTNFFDFARLYLRVQRELENKQGIITGSNSHRASVYLRPGDTRNNLYSAWRGLSPDTYYFGFILKWSKQLFELWGIARPWGSSPRLQNLRFQIDGSRLPKRCGYYTMSCRISKNVGSVCRLSTTITILLTI